MPIGDDAGENTFGTSTQAQNVTLPMGVAFPRPRGRKWKPGSFGQPEATMILGPVSYLDCLVFCILLAPNLLWYVGFVDTFVCVLKTLPFLRESGLASVLVSCCGVIRANTCLTYSYAAHLSVLCYLQANYADMADSSSLEISGEAASRFCLGEVFLSAREPLPLRAKSDAVRGLRDSLCAICLCECSTEDRACIFRRNRRAAVSAFSYAPAWFFKVPCLLGKI